MADESGFLPRVAASVTTVSPLKVLFSLIAAPFYVVGWVLGLLWVAALFIVGAVKLGIADARRKAAPPTAKAEAT